MSGKEYLTNRNYFKPNYFEAFKYILPQYLYDDDIEHTRKETDLVDSIINSNISLADNLSSVLYISGVENTTYSSISNISGISPYFIKQNNLTEITTQGFENSILDVVNRSFSDFSDRESLEAYLGSSLLPSMQLNTPSSFSSTGDTSAVHNYLIENLSWLYFLNTTGTSYDPSSYVKGLIASSLYDGKKVTTADGIKGLMEYVWRNDLSGYYPSVFVPSATAPYLSGTQQLDRLKTWIDVIYSPLYSDRSDFKVKTKFEDYIESNILYGDTTESGPFARFVRALSFLAYDIDNDTEKISTLYDIDDCPDEYLPLLAKLIGWDLFGNDPQRWRLQLRNATRVYKAVGTKRSIQFALNTVFPKDKFPIQTRLTELWESYVPYLIYYALATESRYFESLKTWTPELSINMNVSGYSFSSLDDNLRLATDRIIFETFEKFPDRFNIPNQDNGFFYRNRSYAIPPFEEYPYYVNVELTKPMIDFIADRLVCFGVRQDFALDVSGYLNTNGMDKDDEPRTSSWLLFTSGYNDPPNFDRIVKEASSKKFDYASLWSGKSSHFKLVLDASSFDFAKKGFDDIDSGDAVVLASQMVGDFAPAHSIPLVSLQLSGADKLELDSSSLPLLFFNKVEPEISSGVGNYWVSGLWMNSYKRGINPAGNNIKRSATNTLVSPEILNASTLGTLDRNTMRRRSYEKVMPFNGYYDRTGFNMPTTFGMSQDLKGIPLGLVPSSLSYTPVSSHINLPAVWKQCEDLDSRNSYYQYDVSNTLAARGGEVGRVKNLVIFAGQSNMQVGTSNRSTIEGIPYWNIETSSFTNEFIPQGMGKIAPDGAGNPIYSTTSKFWGPEVKFMELLQKYNNKNTYIFKYCIDNSFMLGLGTVNSWSPSSTGANPIYPFFSENLDKAVSAMGGFTQIKNVTLLWNQGEREAAAGQVDNASALRHADATKYFLDTLKEKFPSSSVEFNIIRVKINEEMGEGGEADYQTIDKEIEILSSISPPSAWEFHLGPGSVIALSAGYNPPDVGAGKFGDTWGTWSWSSTDIVRAQQESLDKSVYGPLISLDDQKSFAEEVPWTCIGCGPLGAVPISDIFATAELSGCPYPLNKGPSWHHQKIHYTSSGMDVQGERLFYEWGRLTGNLKDPYQRDVRNDRGQLPPIYATMHRIREREKFLRANLDWTLPLEAELSFYRQQAINTPVIQQVVDIILTTLEGQDIQSYANKLSNSGDENYAFPASTDDYYTFKFGRDLQRLHQIYVEHYGMHTLSPHILDLDGANLISHTFGPLLYNHDYEFIGSGFASVVTSSIANVRQLVPGVDPFIVGTSYISSGSNDMYIGAQEYVYSGAVDGVELIHTSGATIDPEGNVFSVFKVNSNSMVAGDDPYMFDKTFLLTKAGVGANPRFRFDISKWTSNAPYPLTTNFLLPNHEYNINIKSLVADNTGRNLGGRDGGVWIHTKPESGLMWSYTPDGEWVQHEALVSRSDLISKYTHTLPHPTRVKPPYAPGDDGLECIDLVAGEIISPVTKLRESDFNEFNIKFNTRNRDLIEPVPYKISHGELHRKDQEYIIEMFMAPGQHQPEVFMLFDRLSVQDLTLKRLSERFVLGTMSDPLCHMGDPNKRCDEYRLDLTKQELLDIFKFFNDIIGKNSTLGLASRNKSETETIMGLKGGSRLDYRYLIDWMRSSVLISVTNTNSTTNPGWPTPTPSFDVSDPRLGPKDFVIDV